MRDRLDRDKIEELIRQAQESYRNAYAPYSQYPVGAAILFASQRIFCGCNVENASYGLTICAERNAIFQGIATGERLLRAVAIAVPTPDPAYPCGACRQVMREFAQDCPVFLVSGDGRRIETNLDALLPHAFGPEFKQGQGE